jgi:hypothetical protein
MLAFDIAYVYCATVTYHRYTVPSAANLLCSSWKRVFQAPRNRYSVRDAITRCEICVRPLGAFYPILSFVVGSHFRPYQSEKRVGPFRDTHLFLPLVRNITSTIQVLMREKRK